MDLFENLKKRKLVEQITNPDLGKVLAHTPLTLYCGFDPSSDSLHIGSLLPVLTLRRFQLAGHKPIVVVGGATGMIGDPSGKSQERNLLDTDRLTHNLNGIRKVLEHFFGF